MSRNPLTHRPLALPRLLLGVGSLAVALLAVLPAPTTLLWMLAVVVTEWGHLLAAIALLPLVGGWRRSRGGRIGGICGLVAALLALTPLLRALPVARGLPAQLQQAFGDTPPLQTTVAPPRPAPLVAFDVVRGVPLPRVQPETLVYAQRDAQALKLDLYRPLETRGSAPGVVVIHGGSWQSGDQTQLAPLNAYLAARGYVVAAITYRLAPAHPFPAAYNDVRDALAFLRANAAAFGLDAERLVLLGRSAGGQLALLAAYRTEPRVRGVVSFYGPTDLRWGYANPGNPLVIDSQATLRAYLGGSPDTVGSQYDAAAPLNFVGPTTPPTLLIHGGRDELVSVRHAEFLVEQLRAANRPHLLLRLPWATHGCDYNWSGPSSQLSTYAIERFLANVTR